MTVLENYRTPFEGGWLLGNYRTTPEDGCKEQQPKRCDISSHQDEDKSPNNSLYNTIPSSTNLRKKLRILVNQKKIFESILYQNFSRNNLTKYFKINNLKPEYTCLPHSQLINILRFF